LIESSGAYTGSLKSEFCVMMQDGKDAETQSGRNPLVVFF
jgi:hypothetical protein